MLAVLEDALEDGGLHIGEGDGFLVLVGIVYVSRKEKTTETRWIFMHAGIP